MFASRDSFQICLAVCDQVGTPGHLSLKQLRSLSTYWSRSSAIIHILYSARTLTCLYTIPTHFTASISCRISCFAFFVVQHMVSLFSFTPFLYCPKQWHFSPLILCYILCVMRLSLSYIYPECPNKALFKKIFIPMNKRLCKCWCFKPFQQVPSYRMPFIP